MRVFETKEKTKVQFTWDAWRRVKIAVEDVSTEVAMWVEGEELPSGLIRMDRVACPEHTRAAGAHAEVTERQTAELVVKGEFNAGRGIGSCHSHVNMGAFVSGVDGPYFEKMAMTMPLFVGMVTNKRGEWAGFAYYQIPGRGLLKAELEILYESAERTQAEEAWSELVKERVMVAELPQGPQMGMFPGYAEWKERTREQRGLWRQEATTPSQLVGERGGEGGGSGVWPKTRWTVFLDEVEGLEVLGKLRVVLQEVEKLGVDKDGMIRCDHCDMPKKLRFILWAEPVEKVPGLTENPRGVMLLCGSCAFGKRQDLFEAIAVDLTERLIHTSTVLDVPRTAPKDERDYGFGGSGEDNLDYPNGPDWRRKL